MPLLLGGRASAGSDSHRLSALLLPEFCYCPHIPHYFSQCLFAFENQTLGHHFGECFKAAINVLISVFNSFLNLDVVYFILKNLKSVALSFL